MKSMIFKLIVTGILSFVAGGVTGYFVRKKTEVTFEEVTEEELEKLAKENGFPTDVDTDVVHNTDELSPSEDKSSVDNNDNNHHYVLDTHKEEYFKYWKGAQKYDTRSSDEDIGDDPVDFVIDDIPDTGEDDDEEVKNDLPVVEMSDINEFEHYSGMQDSEYDCFANFWYMKDKVLTDDENNPIDNAEYILGFDITMAFSKHNKENVNDEDYDPDILFMKNNKTKTIYQINRRRGAYSSLKEKEEYGGSVYR